MQPVGNEGLQRGESLEEPQALIARILEAHWEDLKQ